MRYNYYFQNKKQEKEAMQLYAKLSGKNADQCKGCEGHCEQACPFGVNTRNLLALAHKNLSLDQDNYA
jgi:Fe-S-cluster-containing hydrogenase component 2